MNALMAGVNRPRDFFRQGNPLPPPALRQTALRATTAQTGRTNKTSTEPDSCEAVALQ